MSEVKRYTESCMEGGGVAPDRHGEFVTYADFDAEHALRLEAEQRVDDVQAIAIRSAAIGAVNLNKALDRADAAERQAGELREQFYNAESDARNASALLAEVVEWFDDGVGRSDMEFKLLRRIDRWLNSPDTTSTEGKDHE